MVPLFQKSQILPMWGARIQRQARSQLRREPACFHQEASAELGETGKLRRGGETGTMQAPAVQGETAGLRRETEAQGPAGPGETSKLRREDEMQAGEG